MNEFFSIIRVPSPSNRFLIGLSFKELSNALKIWKLPPRENLVYFSKQLLPLFLFTFILSVISSFASYKLSSSLCESSSFVKTFLPLSSSYSLVSLFTIYPAIMVSPVFWSLFWPGALPFSIESSRFSTCYKLRKWLTLSAYFSSS